jgi:tryptophan synthase alpha chain
VYFNTILNYGTEKFVKRCKEIGIDGLIIPDLPLEERGEIKDIIKKYNVCLIPLVAPTSKKRIRKIIEGCKGFVYCVSSLGVTGQRSEFFNQVEKFLQDVKDQSHIPTAVGFGISSRKSAEYLGKFADGVIVGSAIVQIVEESKGNLDEIKERVKKLIP